MTRESIMYKLNYEATDEKGQRVADTMPEERRKDEAEWRAYERAEQIAEQKSEGVVTVSDENGKPVYRTHVTKSVEYYISEDRNPKA